MLLASREIRRAPVRFGLLAGAIGLLIFLVFFQQTLLSSLLNSFTGALQNQSGTVLVYSSEARKNVEASMLSPDVVAKVAAVPGVGQAGPLGVATLTFLVNGQQVDVAVIGAEPGQARSAHEADQRAERPPRPARGWPAPRTAASPSATR